MLSGLLRSRVAVSRSSDAAVRLEHGIWELDIPAQSEATILHAFLTRFITAAELGKVACWRGIAELLDAIGALTFDTNWLLDTRKLGHAHRSLLVEWYGDYYAHPFWETLTSGHASPDQLHRWMLRTYFLSRSVGASASKGALFSEDEAVRQTFRENALEEYDHCRLFYRPDDRQRGANATDQLPISRLVDEHYMAVAECDQWGHVLSALYQEQTSMFHADVLSAYDQIEARYGLPDRFSGWRKHLALDVDCDHAGDFIQVIDKPRPLPPLSGAIALVHAWASARLLLASLDEIVGVQVEQRSAAGADVSYINWRLRFIALKALAGARSESDSVAFGDLLAAVESLAPHSDTLPPLTWTVNLETVVSLNALQSAAGSASRFRRELRRAASAGPIQQALYRLRTVISGRSRSILLNPQPIEAGVAAIPNTSVMLADLLGANLHS